MLWLGIRSDPARCRGRAALRGSRRLHGDEADHPDIATTLHALGGHVGGDPVAPARPPGDAAGCASRWRGASSSGPARWRGRPPGHRRDDPALHAQGLLQNALRGLQVAEALVQTAQCVQRRGDVRAVGLVAVESQVRGRSCRSRSRCCRRPVARAGSPAPRSSASPGERRPQLGADLCLGLLNNIPLSHFLIKNQLLIKKWFKGIII